MRWDLDSDSNSTPLLKPVENDDAGNQIPSNATYTSTISYRTWLEDILCSSIGYNNQIWPISVYELGLHAWTGGYTICGLDYLIQHTNEQMNEQGCFSYHMGEWLWRGFDAGCINSLYYCTIHNWHFLQIWGKGKWLVVVVKLNIKLNRATLFIISIYINVLQCPISIDATGLWRISVYGMSCFWQ
jgi:hypothetical protein